MTSIVRIFLLAHTIAISLSTADAAQEALNSPSKGVLCDQYVCADNHGLSDQLTADYLGEPAADRLLAQGDYERLSFTFSNGVSCCVKDQRCYEAGYHDAKNGKPGRVSLYYTTILFGGPVMHQHN